LRKVLLNGVSAVVRKSRSRISQCQLRVSRWDVGVDSRQSAGFLAVPVGCASVADQVAVALGNVGGEAAALTISDPPTQAEVQALRDACEEPADDPRNLSALIHALRTVLVVEGLIKGEV